MENNYSDWLYISGTLCSAVGLFSIHRKKQIQKQKEYEEQEKTRVYFNEDGKLTRLTGLTDKEFGELLTSINNRKVKKHDK